MRDAGGLGEDGDGGGDRGENKRKNKIVKCQPTLNRLEYLNLHNYNYHRGSVQVISNKY